MGFFSGWFPGWILRLPTALTPFEPTDYIYVIQDSEEKKASLDQFATKEGSEELENKTIDVNKNSILNLPGSSVLAEVLFAASDEITDITTGVAKVKFRMPFGLALTEVRVSLGVASPSGSSTFDLNKNDISILSTKLTVDINEKTSKTAAIPAVIQIGILEDDSEISADFDVVGAGAKGVKFTLLGIKL